MYHNFLTNKNEVSEKRRKEFELTDDLKKKIEKHSAEREQKKRETTEKRQLREDKENKERQQKIKKRKDAENRLQDIANIISEEDKRELSSQAENKMKNCL